MECKRRGEGEEEDEKREGSGRREGEGDQEEGRRGKDWKGEVSGHAARNHKQTRTGMSHLKWTVLSQP